MEHRRTLSYNLKKVFIKFCMFLNEILDSQFYIFCSHPRLLSLLMEIGSIKSDLNVSPVLTAILPIKTLPMMSIRHVIANIRVIIRSASTCPAQV